MDELIIAKKSDITDIADAVREQTGDASLMSLDGIANRVRTLSSGGSGGVSVQANWQQNDEAAPDYIKNRTHWIDSVAVEVLSEMEVNDTYIDLYDVELFDKLTPNAKCVVTIDGTTYETTARHDTYNAYEWYVIGNSNLVGEGGDLDSHLPFGIFIDKYNENWGECAEEILSIKINAVTESVIKIPEIYLPTQVGTAGTGSFSEVFNNLTDNVASGDYSHAENFSTTASGYASSALGINSVASGYGSYAEGCNTEAKSPYSHAEGYYTVASGNYSHVEGQGTVSKGENQHVSGSYNVEDSSSLVIVGNGTGSNNKSNAYKLSKDGSGYFSGDVYAKNKKVATEEYINIRVPAWTDADEGKVLKIINGIPTWN